MKRKILFFISGRKPINDRVHLPLSLMTLASVAEDNCIDYKIIDARILEKSGWLAILKEHMDSIHILGVSCLTGPGIGDAMEAIKMCRENNKKVITIWGGYHATAMYKDILSKDLCDVIIRGHGEIALGKIISEISSCDDYNKEELMERIKEYNNIYVSHYGTDKEMAIYLDEWTRYPRVNYESVDTLKYLKINGNILDFVTSYGCPGHCKFCVEPEKACSKWFGMTAETVVNTMKELYSKYQPSRISIVDPEFGGKPKRLKDIINLFLELKLHIPFSVNFRVCDILFLKNNDLLKYLPEIGIKRVVLGIESGSNSLLKKIGKNQTAENARLACELLSEYEIETYANFIHDFPDETDQESEENLQFISSIAGLNSIVQIHHFFTPLAGSKYYNELPEINQNTIVWENVDTRRAISGEIKIINLKRRKRIIYELSRLNRQYPDRIPAKFIPTLIARK